MSKRRIRNVVGAAVAAVMMVPAMQAPAAAEAAPCQFLMPISPEDVIGCACYRAYQVLIYTTGEELRCTMS